MDDIIIFYEIADIDGSTLPSTLGMAGPVQIRSGSLLPISGYMIFDRADIGVTITQAEFNKVILHEMAHVLGVNDWHWAQKGCISGCVHGAANINYLCTAAKREFNKLGGACAGALPIEVNVGEGSDCGHWAENTLHAELMTPVGGV